MDWKKYTKKMSEMSENNVKLDMETMDRLREILDEIKDKDFAIEFEFLKDYLRLRPENTEAIDELNIKLADIGNVTYRSIIDEVDQKVYLSFSTPE